MFYIFELTKHKMGTFVVKVFMKLRMEWNFFNFIKIIYKKLKQILLNGESMCMFSVNSDTEYTSWLLP